MDESKWDELRRYTGLTLAQFEDLCRLDEKSEEDELRMNGSRRQTLGELLTDDGGLSEWGRVVLLRGREIMAGAVMARHSCRARRKSGVEEEARVIARKMKKQGKTWAWMIAVDVKILLAGYEQPCMAWPWLQSVYGHEPVAIVVGHGLLEGEKSRWGRVWLSKAGERLVHSWINDETGWRD